MLTMGWGKVCGRSQDVAQTLGVQWRRQGRKGDFADVRVGRCEPVRKSVLLLRAGVPGVEVFNAAKAEVGAGGAFIQLEGGGVGCIGLFNVAGAKLRVAEQSLGFAGSWQSGYSLPGSSQSLVDLVQLNLSVDEAGINGDGRLRANLTGVEGFGIGVALGGKSAGAVGWGDNFDAATDGGRWSLLGKESRGG